jgi:hypothetical protein
MRYLLAILIALAPIAAPKVYATRPGTLSTCSTNPGSSYGGDIHFDGNVDVFVDTVLAQLYYINQQIEKIESTPGPPGPPGPAATVDYPQIYAWLVKWIKENPDKLPPPGEATINYTEIQQFLVNYIEEHKEELFPKPDPVVMPLVLVTATKWCEDCVAVTDKVETLRGAGHNIKIVEIDGILSQPPDEFTTKGIPAIHDFNTGRTYVGAQECLAFLSALEG